MVDPAAMFPRVTNCVDGELLNLVGSGPSLLSAGQETTNWDANAKATRGSIGVSNMPGKALVEENNNECYISSKRNHQSRRGVKTHSDFKIFRTYALCRDSVAINDTAAVTYSEFPDPATAPRIAETSSPSNTRAVVKNDLTFVSGKA